MARYRIEEIAIPVIIGVHPHERTRPQYIFVDIEFTADAAQAASTDALADCVDYEALSERVRCELRKTEYTLLERLAQHVYDIVAETAGTSDQIVRVRKPDALTFADSVEIELP